MRSRSIVHCAALEIAVEAETAFAFMADGMAQNRWALGSRDREQIAHDVFAGTSSFEGTRAFVRLEADADRMLVDYHCGTSLDDLRRVVEARVSPGAMLGRSERGCVVTITTWRDPATSDERWDLTRHVWETEIHLIRAALEHDAGLTSGQRATT
jgi:hypothetical protein